MERAPAPCDPCSCAAPPRALAASAPADPGSDTVLMCAAGRGDVQAFSRLVERHLPVLYRLCCRLTGNLHDAEDLTQESFARLWQAAPGWRSAGGGVPAWLNRVARNLCFDRLRAGREVATGDWPDIADATPDAARRMEAAQLAALLETCLRRLSDSHRSALLLSYYEGYSNARAAQTMDMNVKAFESLLLRARRRMSAELSLAGVRSADVDALC